MNETVDAILRGRLRVIQPETGPRFAVDPILLAHFVLKSCGVRARRACDLGAGTGVLGMTLATMDPRVEVTGVELSPELCEMATRGAELNGLGDRVRFQCADVRSATGQYDLVVTNPPYHPVGPVARDPLRRAAHHEVTGTLPEFLAAAHRMLAPRGWVAVVYPADRLQDLVQLVSAQGLRLRALRLVHPRAGKPASRVLLLAQSRVRSSCHVLPPLTLHEGDGFSEQATAILEGKW